MAAKENEGDLGEARDALALRLLKSGARVAIALDLCADFEQRRHGRWRRFGEGVYGKKKVSLVRFQGKGKIKRVITYYHP